MSNKRLGTWLLSIGAIVSAVGLASAAARGPEAGLTATADPRDFEGTWVLKLVPGELPFSLGVDLPYKPQTQDLTAKRLDDYKAGTPVASAHLMCRPTGVQGVTAPKEAVLILQSPEKWVFISQEDREVRQVRLNARHPKNLKPTYSGDAVAHWEGNTLVIDTIGFNGHGQLDEIGNPHSTQLHMIERLTKNPDGNSYEDVVTFEDPVDYTKPFTKVRKFARLSGGRLTDYDCAENPRSDVFETLKFEDNWFRPVCVREVKNGIAADKVTCKAPAASPPPNAKH